MAKKIVNDEEVKAEVIDGELNAVVKVPGKAFAQLVATAPFEIERNYQKVEYKEGDVFSVPEGWARDSAFEEFRKINTKGNTNGISFSVPKPVLDEKGKLSYMDSRRILLPLKEA